MSRLARVVLPDVPHHVTQRGNGRARTFFGAADYRLYLDLLARHCAAAEVGVWAWVLMPNHVHLVLVPRDGDGLRRALAQVHRAYAGRINARLQRTGHFWQGRFGCVALDEAHLLAAVRYIACNPVRARLVARPEDWRWSSVHASLGQSSGRMADDGVTDPAPLRARIPDFAAFLAAGEDEARTAALRRSETIGRPLGDRAFLDRAEALTGRSLRPRKRGPKPADER
jgi:putative transposase